MNLVKKTITRKIIKAAIAEDIGKGDITAKLMIAGNKKVSASILAGGKSIVCGIDIARMVFKSVDKSLKFSPLVKDGQRIEKGALLAKINGNATSILMAERTALNFLGMLSGIAARTGEFINKIKNYRVKLMDTRKTIPGLRELQKYAVKIGGGFNHRIRLDEMVLIKDNYLRVAHYRAGRMAMLGLIEKIRDNIPRAMKIEIEVNSLREFRHALEANPDIIMLDNMKVDKVKKAVIIRNRMKVAGRGYKKALPMIEASGNIDIDNIAEYARSGVDYISLGTLTKDVYSLDLFLELEQ